MVMGLVVDERMTDNVEDKMLGIAMKCCPSLKERERR
jgi:hypothetical protein